MRYRQRRVRHRDNGLAVYASAMAFVDYSDFGIDRRSLPFRQQYFDEHTADRRLHFLCGFGRFNLDEGRALLDFLADGLQPPNDRAFLDAHAPFR